MNKTHGLYHHPLYRRWAGMMSRCYYKDKRKQRFYKSKGIKVCKRWHSFINFYNDLIDGFDENLELDRYPNPNGNYHLKNVRWASRQQNMENLSNSRKITYYGTCLHINEWAIILNIKKETIWARLNSGWSIENALTIPPNLTSTKQSK